MKKLVSLLVILVLITYSGCKTSTQPENNPSKLSNPFSRVGLAMQTDSIEYVRSSGSARVLVQIHNLIDSTFIFPSCEQISYRLDTMREKVWSAGAPLWNSPCIAIYRYWTAIEKDSLFSGSIILTSAGTFRVVTIYGLVPGTYPDTLASNEFAIR